MSATLGTHWPTAGVDSTTGVHVWSSSTGIIGIALRTAPWHRWHACARHHGIRTRRTVHAWHLEVWNQRPTASTRWGHLRVTASRLRHWETAGISGSLRLWQTWCHWWIQTGSTGSLGIAGISTGECVWTSAHTAAHTAAEGHHACVASFEVKVLVPPWVYLRTTGLPSGHWITRA